MLSSSVPRDRPPDYLAAKKWGIETLESTVLSMAALFVLVEKRSTSIMVAPARRQSGLLTGECLLCVVVLRKGGRDRHKALKGAREKSAIKWATC